MVMILAGEVCGFQISISDLKTNTNAAGSARIHNLFEILQRQGFYNAFAGITLPNQGSTGLHEALGFSKVGVYNNVGYKKSKWHDVVWYQLELRTGGGPDDPTPITKLALRADT